MVNPISLMGGLFIKHFLCDFPLQGPYQFLNKGTYMHPGGLLHGAITIFGTGVVLFLLDPTISWSLVAFVLLVEFLVHYHTDWAKMNLNKAYGWGANTHSQFWISLGVDQLIHYATYLWIVSFVWRG